MSQSSQVPTPHPTPQKPKKLNWFLILTIIGLLLTAAGVFTNIPEARCFVLRLGCPPTFQKLTLYTLTEDNKLLEGVNIAVFGSDGPPETAQTDINGYAQVTIANKGIVRVHLSKEGYPSQTITIDLKNSPDIVRTIKLSASGEPEVSIGEPGTDVVVQASPTPTIITTPATPSNTVIKAVENDFMKMEISDKVSKNQNGDVNIAFVITNKTSDNLYLGLNWGPGGTITDNYGQVCGGRELRGLANVSSSSSKPDDFTLISPNSIITVASGCSFPTSTKFNASFPLVRYQPSTTNPAGEHTKFSVGFTGLTLTEN